MFGEVNLRKTIFSFAVKVVGGRRYILLHAESCVYGFVTDVLY